MAAPSATARQYPGGKVLEDGFKTLITCSRDPAIKFWEREVKPVGWKVGDKIKLTSMHNARYETYAFPKLLDPIDPSATVLYDPAVLPQCREHIGLPCTWTWRFSDGSTEAHFGALMSIDPANLVAGTEPTAQIMIGISDYDPTNDVEAGPTFTEVTGT